MDAFYLDIDFWRKEYQFHLDHKVYDRKINKNHNLSLEHQFFHEQHLGIRQLKLEFLASEINQLYF